jgi:FlaA1/EpsC-like NDP-sugar epimerase
MKAFSGDGLTDTGSLFFDPELSRLTTGRTTSLFAEDIKAHDADLRSAFAGRRILVTGGAGSIGSATLELLFQYSPAALHVIDLAENGLVELVRDFRSRPEPLVSGEFRLLPIDYGSAATERLLQSEPAYDVVLHFAAHKHVRSEKDVPSVIQMLDTNVIKMHRFTKWLQTYGHGKRYFAVSTDKAANPTSLMGASKRIMEHVLFSLASRDSVVTSTRFSLLQGFLYRLARRQPLAVPREVRRYFVSPREAAEICLLTAGAAAPGHITFPHLDPNEHLRPLVDIAVSLLQELGLKASFYEREAEACAATGTELARGRYPVLLTPLDTSGEKPYEEFVATDETPSPTRFAALGAVRYVPPPVPLEPALAFLDEITSNATVKLDKSDIARHVASLVGGFKHIETGRSLDDRT